MDASRERSTGNVRIIAFCPNILCNDLSINSPEQRRLGWDEWFEKVSPEGKDWFTNVVSIHPQFILSLLCHVGTVLRKCDEVYGQNIEENSMCTALIC